MRSLKNFAAEGVNYLADVVRLPDCDCARFISTLGDSHKTNNVDVDQHQQKIKKKGSKEH